MEILRPDWHDINVRSEPYTWAVSEPGMLFDPTHEQELAENFPASGFARVTSQGSSRSDKVYSNFSSPIPSRVPLHDIGLAPIWQNLISDIRSESYTETISSILRQPLASNLEIRLVRHAGGDWLSPHTDRQDKLFSHVLYFNKDWQEEWGGCFQILGSNNKDDVKFSVSPSLGTSVLLARSDSSWHQVSEVATAPCPPRMSLLIHGIR